MQSGRTPASRRSGDVNRGRGIGILEDAKAIGEEISSPLRVVLGAPLPAVVAVIFFWLVP
jgi:hypothetical protein